MSQNPFHSFGNPSPSFQGSLGTSNESEDLQLPPGLSMKPPQLQNQPAQHPFSVFYPPTGNQQSRMPPFQNPNVRMGQQGEPQNTFQFPPSNRMPPANIPSVSDLEKQMLQPNQGGVGIPSFPPTQQQNFTRNSFFANMNQPMSNNNPQNSGPVPGGIDQMMARMRLMAQQHEKAKMQNMQPNPNMQPFPRPQFSGYNHPQSQEYTQNISSPNYQRQAGNSVQSQRFDNLFTQQPQSIPVRGNSISQQQHGSIQMQYGNTSPFNSLNIEQQQTSPSPSIQNPFEAATVPFVQPKARHVVVSDVTETSELLDEPELFNRNAEQTTNQAPVEHVAPEEEERPRSPPPPPDPNCTGIYVTNRSKRILAKLPDLNSRKENRINQTIVELLDTLRPTEEDARRKSDLVNRLQKLVSLLWPENSAKLYLFGSAANNFALKKHDVDVCLTIDPSVATKSEIIQLLANSLPEDEVEQVNPLVWARVPILKFKDVPTQFDCDICVNNVLALRNTKLLADYAAIDPRVRTLVLIVKYWAKRRMINEPYTGTLSSYAYVLMVIQFLQTREPPILPCLQQMIDIETKPLSIQGFDCTYNENIDKFRGFGRRNTDSPAKLLVAFFKMYGFEYDYIHSVICVRTGGFLAKDIKQWMIPSNPRECCFFGLEDPFDTTHNLGRVVTRGGMDAIRSEFERGYKILVKTGDFERATRQYTEDNPDTKW